MKPMQRIISVFFCLAIFFLPTLGFYASYQGGNSHSCCDTEQKHHCDNKTKTSQQHTSQGDCEKNCAMHHHCPNCFVGVFSQKYTEDIGAEEDFYSKQKFSYQIPYILSLIDSIWQPPKIG